MNASGVLSPEKVRQLKSDLGYDLKTEEAASWKARVAASRASLPKKMEIPTTAAAATDASFVLPTVGRHTQALEHLPEPTKIRKPSAPEQPDLKKAKLELSDAGMGDIEPGDPIDSQASAETDASIPTSPHFAINPISAPHFDLSKDDEDMNQKTQEDALDDDDGVQIVTKPTDELAHADIAALPAVPAAPDAGACMHAASNSNLNLIRNSSGANKVSGPQPGAGIKKWAGLDAPAPPAYTGPHEAVFPETMPPWVREIMDGFQGLHGKADKIHQEMVAYGADIQAQHTRIEALEQVASEHTVAHTSHEKRIKMLEAKIESLLHERTETRGRSPSRNGLGTGNSSPSPRSPRNLRSDSLGDSEDLDVVIGGWSDARKSDATDEVKNIFRVIQYEDALEDAWCPYSRTSFIKVKLRFPDPQASLQVRRQFQTTVVSKIKAKNFKSGVPGNEGVRIWATKSKTPEERAKIRAIVLTKEFFKNVPHAGAAKYSEDQIEISWAGKVYIDRFQLLGSVDRDGEPQPYDVCIEDSRGNHMNWYIKSEMFSAVTGHPKESLQDLWLSSGPTSAHARTDS